MLVIWIDSSLVLTFSWDLLLTSSVPTLLVFSYGGHLTSDLTLYSLCPPVWAAMIRTKLTRPSGPMMSSPLRTPATRTAETETHLKMTPALGEESVSALSMTTKARNRMSSPSKQVITSGQMTQDTYDFVRHHKWKAGDLITHRTGGQKSPTLPWFLLQKLLFLFAR